MQVKLDPETEARVRQLVESGAYPDQEAVVAAGVRALVEEDEQLFAGRDQTAIRERVLRDFAEGRTYEATPEYLGGLRERLTAAIDANVRQ